MCNMDWPKLTKLKSLFTCFHIIQFESDLKLEWERFRFPSRVVFLVRRERDSMSWQFFSPTFVEWHNACRLLIDDLQIYFLSIFPLYCVCLILSLFFLNQSLLSRGMQRPFFWQITLMVIKDKSDFLNGMYFEKKIQFSLKAFLLFFHT